MKQCFTIIFALSLLFASGNLRAQTIELNPTQDTYVRGGSNGDINYSAETELQVKQGTNDDFKRKTVLQFDLSGINLLNPTAVLKLYAVKNDKNVTLSVLKTEDTWDEATATWNNIPAEGEAAASEYFEAEDINRYYEFDVSNYLREELNNDQVISFIIYDLDASNTDSRFASKEAAENPPVLQISQNPNVQWKLDGNGEDSGIEGADGSVDGGASFDPNNKVQGSHSLLLDGIDGRLTVSNGYTRALFSQRTFTAWINTSDLNRDQIIYEEGGFAAGFGMRLAGGTFEALLRSGNGNVGSISFDFGAMGGNPDEWHHITVAFEGPSNMLYAYLDGTLVASEVTSGQSVGGHANDAGIGARVGGNSVFGSGGTDQPFLGRIDDVRIYEGVLDENDIFSIYDASKPIMLPDLAVIDIFADTQDFTAGNEILFSATITNGGFAEKLIDQDFDVTFFVDGVELSTVTVTNTALAPLGGEVTVQADIPWTSLTGVHEVTAEVDPTNQIEEINEDLNSYSITLENLADFIITGFSVTPSTLIEDGGVPYQIAADVSNRGLLDATGTPIAVRAVFKGEVIAYSDDLTTLASEDTVSVILSKVPEGMAEFAPLSTRDTLFLEVDYDNLHDESRELNNSFQNILFVHENDCRYIFTQEFSDTLVIEAEHYTSEFKEVGQDYNWEVFEEPLAQNGLAVAVEDERNFGFEANMNPALGYVMNIETPGTYTLWAYCYGPSQESNSAYISVNGGAHTEFGRNDWGWQELTTFDIEAPGINSFVLSMREDGFMVDKFILTNNQALNPFGVSEEIAATQCDMSTVYINVVDSVFTYTGNPIEPVIETDRSGFAYSISYQDGIVPTDAGEYNGVIDITSPGYSGTESFTLVIEKAPVNITLENLEQVYDGNAKTASFSFDPDVASLSESVIVTYDGDTNPPVQAGEYEVVVTIDHQNYEGMTSGILIINPATAIQQVEENKFVIYPNPSEGTVQISNAKEGDLIQIYSLTGAKMKEFTALSETQELNLSDLNPGIYTVVLTNKNQKKTSVLIIK